MPRNKPVYVFSDFCNDSAFYTSCGIGEKYSVLNHGFNTLPLLVNFIFINSFMNTNLRSHGPVDIT
jgi:hypothetical protein